MPPASVAALIDEEEQVVAAHAEAVQRNARMLADESKLLARMQNSVDYDVEEYVEALDEFVAEKLALFHALRDRLALFKSHLRAEEYSAHQ